MPRGLVEDESPWVGTPGHGPGVGPPALLRSLQRYRNDLRIRPRSAACVRHGHRDRKVAWQDNDIGVPGAERALARDVTARRRAVAPVDRVRPRAVVVAIAEAPRE